MNILLWTLFFATLVGVIIFHKYSVWIALAGFLSINTVRYFVGWDGVTGAPGLFHHYSNEWVGVTNIFLLITGFGIVSKYFVMTNLPNLAPKVLLDDWKGGFCLLGLVFVFSAFLDNIAAALIGGAVAKIVFNGRVTVGYLAAIVASANAGGAGSVVGDTTTTMMWISGISQLELLPAFIGSVVAFIFCAFFASRKQHEFQPILKDPLSDSYKFERIYLIIVGIILCMAVTTNVIINSNYREYATAFPWIGTAVWIGIAGSCFVRRPDWSSLKETSVQALFLSFLIVSASMMSIKDFGNATIPKAFGLGVASAGFDNIPLTAIAITVGGFIWGLLAYSVGFGGSMTPFGSSAGVSIGAEFPESKDIRKWCKEAWYIPIGYVLGFTAIVVFETFVR